MAISVSIHISSDNADLTPREQAVLAALGGSLHLEPGNPSSRTVGTASAEVKPSADTEPAKAEEAPAEEKPKRKRRTKAQIQAEEAANKAAKAEAEAAEEKAEEGDDAAEDNDDEEALRKAVRGAAVSFLKDNSREDLSKLFDEFGVSKLTELKPDQLQDFLNQLSI